MKTVIVTLLLSAGLWALDPAGMPDLSWIQILDGNGFSPNSGNWAYENDIFGDPLFGLAWIGPGHRGSPQDNHFYGFDPLTETWHMPRTSLRPGRDCLTSSAFSTQDSAIIKMGSDNGHQNGIGRFCATYDTVYDNLWTSNGTSYYSISKNQWYRMKTAGPAISLCRQTRARFDPEHDVVIVHGHQSDFGMTWMYHLRSNTWLSVKPTPNPGARAVYGGDVDRRRGYYYLLGGSPTGYCDAASNTLWRFSPEDRTWTELTGFTLPPWEAAAACNGYVTSMAYSDRSDAMLYVNMHGTAYLFDCNTLQWSRPSIPGTRPVIAGRLAYESKNNLFYLHGGSIGDTADMRMIKGFWAFKLNGGEASYNGKLPAPQASITLGASSAALSWAAVASASGYNVYRGSADPYPRGYVKLNSSPLTGTSYTDNAVTAGTGYAYRVCAVASGGAEGLYSRHLYTRPSRPLGVAASPESWNLVTVSWEANPEPDIVGYNIYRARGIQIYQQAYMGQKLNASPVSGTQFPDSVDLSDRVARGYIVTAVNAFGCESGYSPATTTFPEAPVWVRVYKKQGTTVYTQTNDGPTITDSTIIKWMAPPRTKILGVNIYRGSTYPAPGPAPMNGATLVTDTVTTWYTRGTYGSGTFSLRAVNLIGQEGFQSDQLSPDNGQYTNGEVPFNIFNPGTLPGEEPAMAAAACSPGLFCSPNPFNPVTRILLTLPRSGQVRLAIYDAGGAKVRDLNAAFLAAGRHAFSWDASRLGSGVYLVRAGLGTASTTRKVILMK